MVNKPLLQWTFERLARNEVKEAILAVNKLTEFYIKLDRIPLSGLTIRYSNDPRRKPLGTAGPVKRAERFLGNEPFFVLNGDIFADVSYKELLMNHLKTGATATIALVEVEDPSRYGVAELASDCKIERFIEKPPKGTEPSKLINAGVYVLNPDVLKLIPKGRSVSMEREVFPQLASQGNLYGHIVHGHWMDIGKPAEYLHANRIILEKLNQQKNLNSLQFDVKNPVALDKGVRIGKNSTIGPYAVIGKNVKIGKNARVKNSVIFSGTIIDDSTTIIDAIIGEEARIGKNVTIHPGCIIGDHARVTKGANLANETSVCPAKEAC